MKRLILAMALAWAPVAALAQEGLVTQPATRDVDASVAALVGTIEGVGATVFAVVDHGAGAQSIGSDVGASKLVIFGNPAIGTPAIVDDRLAALFLPLKMLVYEDAEGAVQVAYEDPAAMLSRLGGIEADAEYLARMRMALNNFATNAAR